MLVLHLNGRPDLLDFSQGLGAAYGFGACNLWFGCGRASSRIEGLADMSLAGTLDGLGIACIALDGLALPRPLFFDAYLEVQRI